MVFEAPTAIGPTPFAFGVPAAGLTVVPLPVVPVEPVLPVVPVEPVLPVVPVEPVLPVVPVEPVLPVVAVVPVLPVDPILPVDVVTVGVMLWPGIFTQDDKRTIDATRKIDVMGEKKLFMLLFCDTK
jgi:hypothetical protein